MNRAERRRRTRVVKNRARQPWRQLRWPWATRGAKEGVKYWANRRNRCERARIRDVLKTIDTCDPDTDVENRQGRHQATWDYW